MTTHQPHADDPEIVSPPTVGVRGDRALIRAAARSERFALVEIAAPTVARRGTRTPVNLAFVLDRSGSMAGQKLAIAKEAVAEAIGRLEPDDRFALVVYDDRIEIVAESLEATPDNRRTALANLRAIDSRGTTNLGGGWLTGAEQVALRLVDGGVNRVLLLTDGLANQGITDKDELARHAGELRERGVQTSTFGVGNDFDEELLQAMADAGGGHFYYIATPAQIRDHISSEVGEALEVVARNVRVEITAAEGVKVKAVTPHRLVTRGARSVATVGDLVSGQEVEVVLGFKFPTGHVGREVGAIVTVIDDDGAFRPEPVPLSWRYADHASNDAQPRDRAVDRAVARQFAARAQQEAVKLNREGRYADAAGRLRRVREQIDGYAGSDPELLQLVDALEVAQPMLMRAMPELARKEIHFAASTALYSRDATGRAKRRRPAGKDEETPR